MSVYYTDFLDNVATSLYFKTALARIEHCFLIGLDQVTTFVAEHVDARILSLKHFQIIRGLIRIVNQLDDANKKLTAVSWCYDWNEFAALTKVIYTHFCTFNHHCYPSLRLSANRLQ